MGEAYTNAIAISGTSEGLNLPLALLVRIHLSDLVVEVVGDEEVALAVARDANRRVERRLLARAILEAYA